MNKEIEKQIATCHHGIMVIFKESELLEKKSGPVMELLKLLVGEVLTDRNAGTRFYISD